MCAPDEAEAAAAAMYGPNWTSKDDQKRPGEKMKDVWRRLAAAAVDGIDAYRSSARLSEGRSRGTSATP